MEALLPRFVAVHGNARPDSPFTMYTTMTGGDDNDTQIIDSNDSQHAFQLEPLRDDLPIRPIRRSTLTGDDDINSVDWSEFEDLDWAPSMTKAAKRLTKVLTEAETKHIPGEGDPTVMDKNANQDSQADLQMVKEQIEEIHSMLSTLLLERKDEDGDGNRGPLRSTSPPRSIIPPRTRTIRHARSSSSKNNSSDDDDIFANSRSRKSRDSTLDSDRDISFRSQKSRSKSSKTKNDNISNPLDSSLRSRKSDRIRRSHALNSSAQRVLDRCSPYESADERILESSQIQEKRSVRTTSTKSYSNSIDSEEEDSLLDERLERDYGIPQKLWGHNSFQPGMQHFVYHPSSSKHSRTYHDRSTFDGNQSDPVIRVSQSHHSRTTASGFNGNSSEPSFDFTYREPPKNFKSIPRPPLANGAPSPLPSSATHKSKSFHIRKQASPDSATKPTNKATKSDQKGRRHSKLSPERKGYRG